MVAENWLRDERSLFLTAWILTGSVGSYLFADTITGTMIFYLILPSLYLSIRNRELVKPISVFSLIVGTAGWLTFDLYAHGFGVWFVPTVLDFKLFDLLTVENLVWTILFHYLTAMIYEMLWMRDEKAPEIDRLLLSILPLSLVSAAFIAIFLRTNIFSLIELHYLWMIAAGFLGVTGYLIYREYRMKIVYLIAYMFLPILSYEILALWTGSWAFPGTATSYIGWIELFGQRFPIEESLAFLVGPAGVIVNYLFLVRKGPLPWIGKIQELYRETD